MPALLPRGSSSAGGSAWEVYRRSGILGHTNRRLPLPPRGGMGYNPCPMIELSAISIPPAGKPDVVRGPAWQAAETAFVAAAGYLYPIQKAQVQGYSNPEQAATGH